MYAVIFVVIALVGFGIHVALAKHRSGPRIVELLLLWLFGITMGAVGLFAGLGHTVFAQQTAASIGFPPNNPFQWEVAWADIALGVLGLICIRRRDFWWPTAIANAVFLWGAAWGHIYQLVVNGNHHPDNSGPTLYADILIPLAVIVLLIVHQRLREVPEVHAKDQAVSVPSST
ncbi:MAG: DUF6790 family protein [Candidatus Dormiibacterota bacterium]